MIQPMHFSFDVIAKLLNTILTSIELQWVLNFSIREFAINAPTRWNVLINLAGVWLVGTLAGALNWFKKRFKVHIHHEWDSKLVLPIVKFYCRSFVRHLHSNCFVIDTVRIVFASAQFLCKTCKQLLQKYCLP